MRNAYGWAATHVGHVRETNEDAWDVSIAEPVSAAVWEGALPPEQGWALVADGMGGHAGGEVASRLAVAALRRSLGEGLVAERLPELIDAANRSIFRAMAEAPELVGMGTTIAGIAYQGNRFTAFNVGDSRIYRLRTSFLEQLSEDHVVGGYMLTQCLGGSRFPEPLRPRIVQGPVDQPCRFLLCSDGLTDMVSDAAIRELLARPDSASSLVEAALDAGGHDNVTAVVVELA